MYQPDMTLNIATYLSDHYVVKVCIASLNSTCFAPYLKKVISISSIHHFGREIAFHLHQSCGILFTNVWNVIVPLPYANLRIIFYFTWWLIEGNFWFLLVRYLFSLYCREMANFCNIHSHTKFRCIISFCSKWYLMSSLISLSSGGQVATCSSLLFGTKTIIKKKFSASAFWKDCVKYKITVSLPKHFLMP